MGVIGYLSSIPEIRQFGEEFKYIILGIVVLIIAIIYIFFRKHKDKEKKCE